MKVRVASELPGYWNRFIELMLALGVIETL
jgi:hypothetical protein